jgi:effector-binding domain-containing protein
VVYGVERVVLDATTIASVREKVPWGELSARIPKLCDRVFAFLRARGLKQDGAIVCLYHAPGTAGVTVEAGVQVARPFMEADGVACSSTPAGEAAHTVHWGAYQELGKAHDALDAWCAAQKIAAPGPNWELYGDWSDDPAKLRTDVYRLITPV